MHWALHWYVDDIIDEGVARGGDYVEAIDPHVKILCYRVANNN